MMFRNFITIIVVVGLIILIASNINNIWQWGQDTFHSELTSTTKEDQANETSDQKTTENITINQKNIENNEFEAVKSTDNHNQQTLIEQSETEQDKIDQNADTQQLSAEENLSEEDEILNNTPTEQIVNGVVSKGDTIIELLQTYDNPNRIKKFIDAAEDVFSPKRFIIGQPYTIIYDTEKNNIKSFEYEINDFKKLIISGEPPKAEVEEIVYDKKLTLVENSIEDNLFLAVTNIGETAALAMRIADIFAWEINFIRDIQKNDSFSILVEKLYREGEFKGYGRSFGATFTNNDETYKAYLYFDAKKIEGYYSNSGASLKKVLLQSPLSFTRVTSGYTRSRKHPIFGTYRPHLGIDYGAPTGTPVMAVGDGVVKVRGWVGGYGYQVVISHTSGFESMYSHLSRFPKNVKKGSRVRQGQTIGYVGSTGISTGPHLDFRLKRNGKFINPSKAMSPRGEPINKKNMPAFKKWISVVDEFMNKEKSLDTYTPSMLRLPK